MTAGMFCRSGGPSRLKSVTFRRNYRRLPLIGCSGFLNPKSWLISRVLFIIADKPEELHRRGLHHPSHTKIGAEGSEVQIARGRSNGGGIGLAGIEPNAALVLSFIPIQDYLIIIDCAPGALRLRLIVLRLLGPMFR